jgi:hypothetical protein
VAPKEVYRPPVVIKTETECEFEWGTYSSGYSTSFSGYDVEPLPPAGFAGPADEFLFHLPPPVPVSAAKTERLILSGEVVGANGLPNIEGEAAVSYVTIALVNGSGRQRESVASGVFDGTGQPQYDLDFDFGAVDKKTAVEVTVWASPKLGSDLKIGFWRQPVSELELGNTDKQTLTLTAPAKVPTELKEVSDFGVLYAVLNYRHP